MTGISYTSNLLASKDISTNETVNKCLEIGFIAIIIIIVLKKIKKKNRRKNRRYKSKKSGHN